MYRRRGFTLVELLVVITIIGMLVALLLPAVQSAREAGRRATCLNNQHNLALAMLNFESIHRKFPAYNGTVPYVDAETSTTINDQTAQVSWVVQLFPYLDRNDLWTIWSDGDPYYDSDSNGIEDGLVYFKLLVCPSDMPEQISAGNTPLAYVVNTGLPDLVGDNLATDVRLGLTDASGNPIDGEAQYVNDAGTPTSGLQVRPHNGVFFYRRQNQGLSVSLDYVSAHDGAPQTILLAERLDEDSPLVNPPQDKKWGENPELWGTPERSESFWGACWEYAADDTEMASKRMSDHISSYHGGGSVVSFCDGHQQFVRDDIQYRVYQHLMTPWSQQAYAQAASELSGSGSYDGNVAGVLDEADF